MSTADAVDREAAWLATSGDGLPALLVTAGGPFGVVQAYWPRTPGKRTAGRCGLGLLCSRNLIVSRSNDETNSEYGDGNPSPDTLPKTVHRRRWTH